MHTYNFLVDCLNIKTLTSQRFSDSLVDIKNFASCMKNFSVISKVVSIFDGLRWRRQHQKKIFLPACTSKKISEKQIFAPEKMFFLPLCRSKKSHFIPTKMTYFVRICSRAGANSHLKKVFLGAKKNLFLWFSWCKFSRKHASERSEFPKFWPRACNIPHVGMEMFGVFAYCCSSVVAKSVDLGGSAGVLNTSYSGGVHRYWTGG